MSQRLIVVLALAAATLLLAALTAVLLLQVGEAPDEPAGRVLDGRGESGAGFELPTPLAPEGPAGHAAEPRRLDAPVARLGLPQIAGRVVDDATGEPVRAFRVEVRATGEEGAADEHSLRVGGGVFRMDARPGRYDLVVRADGYLPGTVPGLEIPTLERRPIEIRLSRGPCIEGTVMEEATGLPAPDVTVFLHVEELDPGGGLPPASVARTDGQGLFRFSPLSTGRYSLTLLEPDNAYDGARDLGVTAGTLRVALSLRPRHEVSVLVRDPGGRPVAGASVELTGNGFAGAQESLDSGLALLRWVPDGSYKLAVQRGGYLPAEQPLELSGGQGQQVLWVTLEPARGG